jgi:hypothetical protein
LAGETFGPALDKKIVHQKNNYVHFPGLSKRYLGGIVCRSLRKDFHPQPATN